MKINLYDGIVSIYEWSVISSYLHKAIMRITTECLQDVFRRYFVSFAESWEATLVGWRVELSNGDFEGYGFLDIW